MPTRTLSVVFTDIKGFTARTSSSSRAELRDLLDRHEELLLPVIHHYDGTVVKTIGDAFLLTFESPTNAVLCGLMIQETLREFNQRTVEAEQIEVRVAINTGEVEVRGSDVFGETVNIAARIESITEAGEVYFTHATYLSMNKSEVPTSEVGERRLKGIDEPIRVYRVIRDENLERYNILIASEREGQQQSKNEKPHFITPPRKRTKLNISLLVGIVVAAIAGIFGPSEYAKYQAGQKFQHIARQIAEVRSTDERDELFSSLNKLVKTYPDNLDLHYRITLTNGKDPYWIRAAFERIPLLVRRDKQYQDDEALSEILFKSLGYLDLDKLGSDTKDGELRTFIAQNYAHKWRAKLLPMVQEFGAAERIERRNAYLVLKQSPIAQDMDELRYFTIELWGNVDSGNVWNARTLSFLEAQSAAESGDDTGTRWTPNQRLPEYLQYFNDEADRAVNIVSSLYAVTLRTALEEAIVGDDLGFRLHSLEILEDKGWLTDELVRAHQMQNLESYWKGYTSPWVVDAVNYFAEQEPSTVAAPVLEQLEKIVVETRAIIDSGELPDKRQLMDDYRTRLDAALRALKALKK